jgi:hypothetical protein
MNEVHIALDAQPLEVEPKAQNNEKQVTSLSSQFNLLKF